MKKYFFVLIIIALLFLLSPENVFAQSPANHSVTIQIDPDTHNDAFIKQSFLLIGTSNSDLTSGVTIELPFDQIRISSITINNKAAKYSQSDSRLFIDLASNPLRLNMQATVIIDYSVIGFLYSNYSYKFLDFPNPIPGSSYSFSIVNISSQNKTIVVNTPGSITNGRTNLDLFAVFGKESTDSVNYELGYSNIEKNTIIPIMSESLGTNNISTVTNSTIGISDNQNNSFLIGEGDINISGKITYNAVINSFPFKKLEIPETIQTVDDIYKLKDKYQIDTVTNYTQDYDTPDFSDKKLNNIEYAVLISKSFSKLQIPNRVVYGIVFHPDKYFFEHFWVEYYKDGKKNVYDQYLNKLLSINNDISYPVRFPIGVYTPNNLNNISYIKEIIVNNLYYTDTQANKANPDSLYIDLIKNELNNTLVLHNNSDSFLRIVGADNQLINDEIANILILPGTKQNIPIFINETDVEVNFEFELSGETFSRSYKISKTSNFREFYAQIGIGIFGVLSIVFIISNFVTKAFTQKRYIQRAKNKLRPKK